MNQKPGETRLDLLARNAAVFAEVVGQVRAAAPEAILIVATNPVDIMGQVAQRLSGWNRGASLHRARCSTRHGFRSLLGAIWAWPPGSYMPMCWANTAIARFWPGHRPVWGRLPLASVAAQARAPLTEAVRAQIDDGVRRAAYRIIQGKGATWYGIGAGWHDRSGDRADEVRADGLVPHTGRVGVQNVALSLPRIVGAKRGHRHALARSGRCRRAGPAPQRRGAGGLAARPGPRLTDTSDRPSGTCHHRLHPASCAAISPTPNTRL